MNTISAIVSAGKPPCFRPFLKSLKDFSRNRSVLRSLQASKSEPWLKRTFSADASVQRRARERVPHVDESCKQICHVAVSPTSSFFSKPADLVATGIPQPNSAKIVAEVCANPASPPRRAHRVRHARLDIRSAGWITFCVLCVAQARSTQLHTSIIRRLVEAGATRQLQKIWKDAPRPAKRAQRQAVDQGRQGNVRRLLCEAIGAAQLG